MAKNYTTTSTVSLQVNAKQASQMLDKLKKDTANLEKQFQKAEKAGDKVAMKNLRKSIKENQRLMKLLTTETAQAADVLNRLDRATPKELNKTLKTLRSQLSSMQRGTDAWNKQVAAIKRVKAEIDKVNASMAMSKTGWQKFNGWLNNTQTAIMGIVAAVSGLVAAGRQAVNRYAEMDEAVTNSVKYTRMSRQEVEQLNEAFKKMDTRLYRDQLNLLAQEGGRLGYNTIETVKGYTEAAQIINVALVDLGEGATQTIAKLTNIFGVEQALGIKKAMLSVGSAVNVLSQNCTASKPYLVDFAQRMAGIGAQAGMTIPQILALGAVLDANGQKVEMSATAIQKVMMNLANKNKEFAKTLGLDAKVLNNTLKHSAIDGLMMFLQRLHDIGESTSYENATMALAPAFKEMGLDAARVAQVLSTLSKHIDEIKWQLGEADTAFKEASSATNEFNLFNNTAQASIEKAKGRVRELAIELGEKLFPIMKHIYTSSGVFLRVLNAMVTFFIHHKTAISSLALAIVGYNLAVHAAALKTKVFTAATVVQNSALTVGKSIVLLFSTALYTLTGNMTKARASMRLFNMTLAANPVGAVIAALSALIPLIIKLCSHTDTYIDKANKVIKKSTEISEATIKEQRELGELVGKLVAAKNNQDEYKKVKEQFISQYGRYLSGLINEEGEIINLTEAYKLLANAVERANRLRSITNAKDELTNEHDQEQLKNINALQKSLEDYGADPVVIGKIIQEVTMAVANETPIPQRIVATIQQISNSGLPSYDNKDESLLGSLINQIPWINLSRKVYKNISTDSPATVLDKIITSNNDYKTGMGSLENLELAINPTNSIANDALLRTRNNLNKIVEGNKTDYVEIPNFYIPEGYPISLFTALDVNDERRQRNAVKDNPLIGTSPLDPSKNYIPFSENDDKPNYVVSADGKRQRPVVDSKDNLDRRSGSGFNYISVTPAMAKQIMEQVEGELRLRGITFGNNADSEQKGGNSRSFTNSDKNSNKNNKDDDKFKSENEWRDWRIANAKIKRAKGYYMKNPSDWEKERGITDPYRKPYTVFDYDAELLNIDKKYYQKILKRNDLKKDERKKFEAEFYDNRLKRYNYVGKINEDQEAIRYNEAVAQIKDNYMSGVLSKDQYDQALNDEELMHFAKLVVSYQKLAKDAMKSKNDESDNLLFDDYQKKADEYEAKLYDLEFKNFEDRQNKLMQSYQEFKKKFNQEDPEEIFRQFNNELIELFDNGFINETQFHEWSNKFTTESVKSATLKENNKSKAKSALKDFDSDKKLLQEANFSSAIDDKEYAVLLSRMKSNLRDTLITPLKESKSEWVALMSSMTDAWMDFAAALKDPEGDPFAALSNGIAATAAVMSAVMSQITEFTKAEMQIQTAAIEKRYDREIAFAEGNSYLTKKLEKEKQDKIAKIKEEAANKEFTMQVIMAIAQTATNALNAYGSAAAIPVVGHVLAPIAAATAVAAGMVQVAAIKKQKEAAAATGYSKGGFTKPGDVDEPAGVVHAGEWVASQKLVKSPVARPIIDMLEYAQRTNRIGSLSMEDVSRSITAPMRIASMAQQPVAVQVPASAPVAGGQAGEGLSQGDLAASLDKLNSRLENPIVAVSSVAGEFGSKRAEEKYNRMMRNKSPRKRS